MSFFYRFYANQLEIVRILHQRMGINTTLQPPTGEF